MKLSLGYYHLDSAQGTFPKAGSWSDFTYCEGWDLRQGAGNYHRSRADFEGAMARAVARGFGIHLNMQWGPSSWPATLKSARPYWPSVTLVDFMDEPGLGRRGVQAQVRSLKQAFKDAGLAPKRVGAVFNSKRILHGDGFLAPALDYAGCEFYLPATAQDRAVEELKKLAGQLFARLPADLPLIVVIQSYTRDGTWRIGPLKSIQRPSYDLAKADPRVFACRWFTWGMKDGVRNNRSLIPIHKQIAAIEATA